MLDEMARPDQTDTSLSAKVTRASLANDRWASAPEAPAHTADCRVVSIDQPDYPEALRAIESPPRYLNVLGQLNEPSDSRALAIVGSRTASSRGLGDAYRLAGEIAARGHTIVSGLAAGIDTQAHRGTIAAGGRTIAVVGTGVDVVYPAANRQLRNEIAAGGAVVSQFAMGHQPSKTTFPARNVLIAGLSQASLLIELSERSGTRIEATVTLEQGKHVLLWAPTLAAERWAQEFAEHPLVSFVSDADEIAAVVSGANGA